MSSYGLQETTATPALNPARRWANALRSLRLRRFARRQPPDDTGPALLRHAWVLVAAYAVIVYLLVNYALPGRIEAEASLYVAQPILWGSLAALALGLMIAQKRLTGALSIRLIFIGFWAAGFHVAALVGVGIIYGFGYTPYAQEPVNMAQNGLYLLTMILGIELARAYVVTSRYERSPFLTLFGVTLLFTVIMVPAKSFESLGSVDSGLRITGSLLMPTLAQSLLATFLVSQGGIIAAVLYFTGLRAFEWFSPILPNPEWTIEAFVSTITPLVILLAARGMINEAQQSGNLQETKKFDVSAPWVIATMLVVGLLWFNTGLLGVQPTVVTGVSMEPTLSTGDLVITKPANTSNLEVGDIVRFNKGQTPVMHRITEIQDTPTGRVIVTQGDNNNTPDDPLLESQIEGEVIFTVPKLGWVPIGLSKALYAIR